MGDEFIREPMSSRLRESLPRMAAISKHARLTAASDGNGASNLGALLITVCANSVNALEDHTIPIDDQNMISDALHDIAHLAPDLIETIEGIQDAPKQDAAFHAIWLLMQAAQTIGACAFINQASDEYYKTRRGTDGGKKAGKLRAERAELWQAPLRSIIESAVQRPSIKTYKALYAQVRKGNEGAVDRWPSEKAFSRYVQKLERDGLSTNIRSRQN